MKDYFEDQLRHDMGSGRAYDGRARVPSNLVNVAKKRYRRRQVARVSAATLATVALVAGGYTATQAAIKFTPGSMEVISGSAANSGYVTRTPAVTALGGYQQLPPLPKKAVRTEKAPTFTDPLYVVDDETGGACLLRGFAADCFNGSWLKTKPVSSSTTDDSCPYGVRVLATSNAIPECLREFDVTQETEDAYLKVQASKAPNASKQDISFGDALSSDVARITDDVHLVGSFECFRHAMSLLCAHRGGKFGVGVNRNDFYVAKR